MAPPDSTTMSVDASSLMSSTKRPSLAGRVKSQLRRRFTKRGKSDASSLHSTSSSAFLPNNQNAASAGDGKNDLKPRPSTADDEHHHPSDTLSTSSTLVAENELPKTILKPVAVVLADGDGPMPLDASVAFSMIDKKEAVEGDVQEMEGQANAQEDNSESAPKQRAAGETLSSSIEQIPLDVLPKPNSDVPEAPAPPQISTKPELWESPIGDSNNPNILVAGLTALILAIPLPNLRYSIRALPLSFFVLWFLYQQ